MKGRCIEAIQQALGRQATKSELDEIESRLSDHMRKIARGDKEAVAAMTPAERVQAAADSAAKELIAEKSLQMERAASNIIAKSRIRARTDARHGKAVESLIDHLVWNGAGSDVVSVESAANAIRSESLGNMLDAIIAAQPKFLGLFESTQGVEDLFNELYGVDTGNAVAREGAIGFKRQSEDLRQRANRSGMNIGKLEDWSLPNHHSHDRLVIAGREKWVDFIGKRLDRQVYLNRDGYPMTDAEFHDFLDNAYMSITTGGANKILDAISRGENVPRGSGGVSNRGSSSRQLHFKDVKSHREYLSNFGDKSLLDIMVDHISGISRDIAMVETLGPNAIGNFLDELEYAKAVDKIARPEAEGEIDGSAKRAITIINEISGNMPGVGNKAFANIMRGIRSINVMKLGSAYFSSLSDHGFSWLNARTNKLNFVDILSTQYELSKSFKNRDWARRHALGIESMLSGLSRMSGDGFESYSGAAEAFANHSRKLGSAVMKASFLQQATDIRRQAVAIHFMDSLGSLVKKSLDKYDPEEVAHLKRVGITDTDWKVWGLAKTEDPMNNGGTVLTANGIRGISDMDIIKMFPDEFGKIDFRRKNAVTFETAKKAARMRDDAATKLLATVLDESMVSIPEPRLRDRISMRMNSQQGTIAGELLQSFWQFKAFGFSAVNTHLARAKSIPNGVGKAAYAAKLVASTTLGGAIAYQLASVSSGLDFQDMNPETKNGRKFWMAAFLKGGGLGIYGDFLFSHQSKSGSLLGSVVLGPTGGMLIDPIDIATKEMTYASDIASGYDANPPDTAAATLRYVKQFVPGSSLWYLKGAFDHLIWHDLQESASPGYLDRMKGRIERETGRKFWWEPGNNIPNRAPEVGAQ